MIDLRLQKIFENNPIVEYLSKRGIDFESEIGGGKYRYLCPFSDHKETKPSFVVYTNNLYDNFYCFGCSRGGSIINLVSFLDNITLSNTVKILSDGITIIPEEELNKTIENINSDFLVMSEEISENEFVNNLMDISMQCLAFSQGVNFDEQEMLYLDKYYAFIDENLNVDNFNVIVESMKYLSPMLKERTKKFRERIKKKNEVI